MQSDCRLGTFFRKRTERGRPGLPLISVTMNNGLVSRDTLDRKTDSALSESDHLLIKKGDIAYNMMRMWQGASGLAKRDGMVSPAYVVVAPKEGIDPLFASYWFKSPRMLYLFWAFSYGLTGDRLRLYFKDFARVPATPPPFDDQIRAAGIVHSFTQTIERLEKLIAAKRRLKKGLGQQLLTGHRRLPGFDDKWTTHEFGNIACLSKARRDPQSAAPGTRCVELEHISQGDGRLLGTVSAHEQRSLKAVFEPGDLLFGKLRPNLRKSYLCQFSGLCSTEIWVLQSRSPICSSAYLAQLVQTHRFISAACVTAGSKMPRAEWSYVAEIPFEIPHADEQHEIVLVLEAIDTEIELLERQLSLFTRQKNGLMQKLFFASPARTS